MAQHDEGQRLSSEPSPAEPIARGPGVRDALARLPALPVWQVVAIGVVVIIVGLSLTEFLEEIVRPLALLFAAIIIAEALSPFVDVLERKLPRGLAVAIPYLLLLAIVVGAGWLLFPVLVSEAQHFVDRGPELINQFQSLLNAIDPTGNGRIASVVTDWLNQASGTLSDLPFTVMSSILELVLVLAMSIYWLIAKPSMRRFFLSLVPERRRDDARDVLGEMGETIGGYVRAEILTALVIGVLSYVGLTVIGVQYAIVLGVIAALGELVPVLGPILAGVPAVAVALLESPQQAVIVLIFYIALQQIESNILLPNLMQQQAHIPQLLAIFSLFVGATVLGLLGALIAIPLSGTLKVLVVRVLAPAIRRWSGANRSSDEASSQEAS